jgi:hypothetical protein
MENKKEIKMRRCMQDNCGHNIAHSCRACAACNCPSLWVNDDCKRCNDCENIEDSLRWDKNPDDDKIIRDLNKLLEKVIENIDRNQERRTQIIQEIKV